MARVFHDIQQRKRLNVLARGVRRLGLTVQAEVIDGVTCNAILEAADRRGADLLVLGVHGIHRRLEHLLIGSDTEKIMLSANCPVLTVGSHVLTGFDAKLHLKEILPLSDFTPESALAVPYAFQLAEEFKLPVEVCQLIPDGAETTQDQVAEDYCRALKDVLEDRDSEWCKPGFQLDRGMAVDEIVYRAESQNAGLIVLGAHTESRLGRRLRTSFAYQILGRATCPVLTVRSNLAL